MPFASALSQHPDPVEATGEAVGEVFEQLDAVPDLALLFCSPHHADAIAEIAATVRSVLSPRVLVGTTASAIVGDGREVEDGPALSLWAAALPSVPRPVRLTAARTRSGVALQGLRVTDLPAGGTLLLLADPYSLPADAVLAVIEAGGSPVRVAGGMASPSAEPGRHRLVLDNQVVASGAVGVVLDADVHVTAVVSQACRPIGDPMIVTAADGNVLLELAGRPALERVAELAGRVDPDERLLLASGLHLGIAVDEHRTTFGRGDFLVRDVLGADRQAKAVVMGEPIPVGTTVQFQVRDAAAADEDLNELLAPLAAGGALLFTCNGRGTRLFDRPDHDARALRLAAGAEALAGMFCAGELGPVGDRSFVHTFSASVLLFHDG